MKYIFKSRKEVSNSTPKDQVVRIKYSMKKRKQFKILRKATDEELRLRNAPCLCLNVQLESDK